MSNIRSIKDLHLKQCKIWKEEWETLFGVTPFDEWETTSEEEIKKHLDKSINNFWINGTNKFKELLINEKCNNIDKLIKNSWEFVFDDKAGLLCLYASFTLDDGSIKRSPIAYLPYPDSLNMYLNGTKYFLRISVIQNYRLIRRIKNIFRYQRIFDYDLDTDTFNFKDVYLKENPNIDAWDNFIKYDQDNLMFLSACLGREVNNFKDFKEALIKMPEYDGRSILYFKFSHLNNIFSSIENSKRFANPLNKVPITINVVKMISSRKGTADDTFNNICLATNELGSLENSRTVLYNSSYNMTFNFTDCIAFFDSFKTSTNKSAGRSRLLLDDVDIINDILYRDGMNMYDYIINQNNKTTFNNLSVLSCSNFSTNNDAKRIMMTAKLRPQAIPTDGETDEFCHETPARVVFGDYMGFNYGDSIIISESFAKKLQSKIEKRIRVVNNRYYQELIDPQNLSNFLISQNKINPLQLQKLTGSNQYMNYRNIEIISLDSEFITIKAIIPFGVGDKITNLHGSKGVVSIILPDDQMPYLENDLGPNMPKGPFDIILSGLSAYKRKSFGMIFEAWSKACGITDVSNVTEACNKYEKEMKEYSEKSVISFNSPYLGKITTIKPCGINSILRLNHNAVGKQSFSYLKSNYGKMLKLEEMLILNFAARNLTGIINELDIRSINKHYDSLNKIYEMQKTGYMSDNEPANNLKFFNILNTIGFNFTINDDDGNNIYTNNIVFSSDDEREAVNSLESIIDEDKIEESEVL